MKGIIYELLEASYFDSNQSVGALYHTNCRPYLYTESQKGNAHFQLFSPFF
jgi:hypothetical protein